MHSVTCHGSTDAGLIRSRNEDHFVADERSGLFIVADGVASCGAGHIASQMACESMAAFVREFRRSDAAFTPDHPEWVTHYTDVLEKAVHFTNRAVFEAGRRRADVQRMSTTLVGLQVLPRRCISTNVGDSRLYRVRKRRLERLTEDHTLLDEARQAGIFDGDEEHFPYRNVITRAIGHRENVKVDVRVHTVRPGDVFILCTDGLTSELSDHFIRGIAIENEWDPRGMADALVQMSNRRGGRDNVTVVVVQVPRRSARTSTRTGHRISSAARSSRRRG